MQQISIDGTLNFRPVRAYRTPEGRLKPQSLYRSGEFHGITPAGIDGMRLIGVTTVFDLRSDTEKSQRSSPLLALSDFRVLGEPHDIRAGDLRSVLLNPLSTAQASADAMRGIYDLLPVQFTPVYKRYFRSVIESTAPIAIHCAAGKDRTGVGIALLLDLLGVSRDDIMEDYLATNEASDQLKATFRDRNSILGRQLIAERLIAPVLTADPTYLATMFAAVARDFGDTPTYARDRLGLSEDDVETLKQRLIE
jgi:protein-tyrosine phosphatase